MENLFGRLLTQNELTKALKISVTTHKNENLSSLEKSGAVTTDRLEKLPAMTTVNTGKIRCNRCGTIHEKTAVQLPIGSYYCPTCLNLGRVRSDEWLYHAPQQVFPLKSYLTWTGKLTADQQKISDRLAENSMKAGQFLVQAVTGAGKTEMIYAAIDRVLASDGCVGLASPRIDVCRELHARLSRDFACPIPLLHGGGQPYFRAPLVIATTHQLLRFRQAFDLLIIDEVDAFPFRDSPELYFAAENARKADSCLIYLTATSTDFLENQVKSGKIQQLTLPRRFHGFPLVVPQFIWHKKFLSQLKKQRQTGFPLLIFLPEIELGQKFAQDLQAQFPHEKIGFVASTTANRLDLVDAFRQQKLTILVSTTILERGVTFPEVDVFVVQADHAHFTKSALIQISGRVGRSNARPDGLVSFFHAGKSRAMVAAKREIIRLNQMGGF